MKTMSTQNILKLFVLIALNLCIIAFAAYAVASPSDTTPVLSQYGSRGAEVREIQTKLKNWGYFKGTVDGIYGEQTVEAVKYFQRKNGLTADGIAGARTLAALGITPSKQSGSSGGSNVSTSDSDYQLLARIISAEARGESYIGQVAVGAVVLNRVEHPSFPDTLAGVVYQPGAFTAINDGQINQPIAESAYRAAKEALNGNDPSGGALYYFNPDKTSNKWIRTRPVLMRIGNHLFCS